MDIRQTTERETDDDARYAAWRADFVRRNASKTRDWEDWFYRSWGMGERRVVRMPSGLR